MRSLLSSILVAALIVLGTSASRAEDSYPNRPVHIVVGYSPGSSTTIVCRLVADKLSQRLGQPVVVVNKPGAAGLISAEMVANASPDGYTLLAFNPDLAGVVPAIYKDPPYDPVKDFAHISTIYVNPGWTIAVNPKVAAKDWNEFVTLAKTSDVTLNYGTYGIGSLPHLHFESLKSKLGIDLVHIPYKGGALSYQAAMSGEVQVVAGTSFIELLRAGKLRPIAVGGSVRSRSFPDLPTLAELGLGDQIFGPVYAGLSAPAGTPRPIIDRLSAELKEVLAQSDVVERISTLGEATYMTPEQFTKMVRRDFEYYGPLVKSLGLAKD